MDEEKKAEEPKSAKSTAKKRSVEDKLDDIADRFSKSMSDGVKRMEDVFDRTAANIKANPEFSKGEIKGFFSTTTGAGLLIVMGFVWLFYAVGLLDRPIFPIAVIIVGFFLMQRAKS